MLFGRKGVELALMEEGCLPSRGTEMVRTIDAASFAATAAPAAQHDVKPATVMFDSESTAGIETAANTVGTSDRKLDLLRHEDLKSEALEESNTTAATPAELKERKVLALQTSLEKSFFSIEQMFDDSPDAAEAAYPLSTSGSFLSLIHI